LYTIIGFIVAIMVILYVVPDVINSMGHTSMVPVPLAPLIGSSVIQLPSSFFGNSNSIQMGITVITTFEYTFYLGVAAAVLGIVARIYHRKVVSNAVVSPPTAVKTPTPASQSVQ
jgi:hypothetical protein